MFGDSTLRDFGFALLVGVTSGAYSSIFIASPVLTHWKEREPQFRHRRQRIIEQYGFVPAYAGGGADVEPKARKRSRATLSEVGSEELSAAEFEELKRGIAEEERERAGHTSTLMRRMARTDEEELDETQERDRAHSRSVASGRGATAGAGAAAAPTRRPTRPPRRSQRLRAEAAEAERTGAPPPLERRPRRRSTRRSPRTISPRRCRSPTAWSSTTAARRRPRPNGVAELGRARGLQPARRAELVIRSGRRAGRRSPGSDDPDGDQPRVDDASLSKPKPPPRARSRNRRHGRRR